MLYAHFLKIEKLKKKKKFKTKKVKWPLGHLHFILYTCMHIFHKDYKISFTISY